MCCDGERRRKEGPVGEEMDEFKALKR